MLVVEKIEKTFIIEGKPLRAVDRISFTLPQGHTLGIIGESGCGKSTLAKIMIGLEPPTKGTLYLEKENILQLNREQLKKWRRQIQMIFQNSYASLDPLMRVEQIIKEPLQIHNLPIDEEQIRNLFDQVGVRSELKKKYPHELSGGQRQLVGIARALTLNPSILICDEAIASLDTNNQMRIATLLKELNKETNFSLIFISHDLKMTQYLTDHLVVIYLGKIVEQGPSSLICSAPSHPYTEALIAAIPDRKKKTVPLSGEPPSPFHRSKGCLFASRCPYADPICREIAPFLQQTTDSRAVACHKKLK